MKRKWLITILAMAPVALAPLTAIGQVAPDRTDRRDRSTANPKYEIHAGWGYTSLNQVNQSRHGLQGVNLSVTRDWGKYFGIIADGAYFPSSLGSGNPGNPNVESVLFGPVLHAPLYGPVSGYFRGLLGGEHTGGESQTPKVSFAGGVGIGLDYAVTPHFSVRVGGDDVASSFSLINNSSDLKYSPHMRWNGREMVGIVYKF